jgi:predicted negative regulator of RcsB-dependent stress response
MTRTGAAARPPVMDDRAEDLGDWLRIHTREVGIAAVVVAGLAGGVMLYQSSLAKRAAAADAALAAPEQSIASGNLPLAQADLRRVVTRYPGTAAAAEASILLAETYYDQQKYAEGLAVLQKAPTTGPAKPFASSIASLTAAGLAQQGRSRDAAANYLRAAQLTPYASERDAYKASAARAYANAGDTASAIRIWTELAADPKLPVSGEARLRLGELTAKAATKS